MRRIGLSLGSAVLALGFAAGGVAAREPQVTRHVLPNGMTVLVRENPAVPAVAVSLQVRAGSRFETETTAGITNFLHRAMLRGTAKRTAEQFATSYEDMAVRSTRVVRSRPRRCGARRWRATGRRSSR